MKIRLTALLIYASVLASPAYASSIYSSVSASSDTGGNTAGPGVVVHAGSASAHTSVTTIANGAAGSSTIDIETVQGGVHQAQHMVRPIAPGKVVIKVATSTATGSAHAAARVHIDINPAASSTSPSWIRSVINRLLGGFFSWFR